MDLYNEMKWPSESTDLFGKMVIFVRVHTLYNTFAFIGYATLRIPHKPSQMIRHCNRYICMSRHSNFDMIGLYLTSDLSLKMCNTKNSFY